MSKYLFLLGLILLAGCKTETGPKTVEASGTVTLDGNPVDKAQVTFIDAAGSNPAVATTDAMGKFSLKYNGEKDGAIPGEYKVQVSKTLLEGNNNGSAEVTISYGLPKKYANIVTSGLTQNVPDTGINNIEIKLQSK